MHKIQLKDYSSKAIQFLMNSLMAKCRFESAPNQLLSNELALELFDLAMRYGFVDLLLKTESFAEFMNSKLFADNVEAWWNRVDPYIDSPRSDSDNHLVNALIEKIVPDLLNIDIKPLNGKFLIPMEYIDLFFDEDTRDLMPRLPVMLDMKDEKDFDVFQKACEAANLKTPPNFIWPPIPSDATIYGIDNLLRTHFEEPIFQNTAALSANTPPLPAHIGVILNSPCPFYPDKKVKDTHFLMFIPGADSGVNPSALKTGNMHIDQSIRDDINFTLPEFSHWILITRNVFPERKDEKEPWSVIPKSQDEQYSEIEALLATKPGYEMPDLLSAVISVRVSKSYDWTTICKETCKNTGVHLTAGKPPRTSCYSIEPCRKSYFGVAPLRRFL